jgi:hypothetical protein
MLLGIRWRSMRAKIIAWSFVPTALILIAVAWVTFTAYQRVTEDLVIERNQELTRLSTGEFAAGLTEYTGLLKEYTGLLADLARSAFIYESDPIAQRGAGCRFRAGASSGVGAKLGQPFLFSQYAAFSRAGVFGHLG